MKKLLFILPFIALILSSCSSSEPRNDVVMQRSMINRIITNTTGDIEMKVCNYSYSLDLVNMKVTITIPALSLDDSNTALNIEIPEMAMTTSAKTGYTFSGTNIVPLVNGVANADYTITSLSGNIYGAEAATTFTIGGKYTVGANLPEETFGYSVTTVVSPSGTTFGWDKAQYVFGLSASKATTSLSIYNIKFADKMPIALAQMDLKDIKLTPSASGYSFSADKVIPSISNTPYEDYALTNLQGTIVGSKATFTFGCMGNSVTVIATMHEVTE